MYKVPNSNFHCETSSSSLSLCSCSCRGRSNNMGRLGRYILLFVLLAASLLSTSFAGHRKLFINPQAQFASAMKGSPKKTVNCKRAFIAHQRVLVVKTNDYGSYDPSPSLAKPPFKLIPN